MLEYGVVMVAFVHQLPNLAQHRTKTMLNIDGVDIRVEQELGFLNVY